MLNFDPVGTGAFLEADDSNKGKCNCNVLSDWLTKFERLQF
jgi:hypothetical protein